MGRPKKVAATSSEEVKPIRLNTDEIVALERKRIKSLLTDFVNSRGDMIERHLNQVKESTGEIHGEDVAYVLNLFTRELNHLI